MNKIMFNDKYCLTKAVLERRKTMTRRVVVGLPPAVKELRIINGICEMLYNDGTLWLTSSVQPKYKVGEEVAVAQSYKSLNEMGFVAPEWLDHTCESSAGYNNKMFVNAELMPYRIRITDTKAKRLQDISDDDCLKEGIVKLGLLTYSYKDRPIKKELFRSPRFAFSELIDKVSGKGTWQRNPWVFAYEFELVK